MLQELIVWAITYTLLVTLIIFLIWRGTQVGRPERNPCMWIVDSRPYRETLEPSAVPASFAGPYDWSKEESA